MEIIFEDAQLMVLNKPAGVVVNRSNTASSTVQDWLDDYLGLTGGEGELMRTRSGLVHRLDKETSGCLLIGKNEESLSILMRQFKDRKVEKEYLALVHGWIDPSEGAMSLPISRDRRNREKRTVSYEGKRAETRWKVEKQYLDGESKYCLVRIWPKTGRTHQIRVHMAHIGHPLFSDAMYLNSKKSKVDRELLDRHFLHAAKIQFRHPVTKKIVKVEAKIGEELQKVLDGFDQV